MAIQRGATSCPTHNRKLSGKAIVACSGDLSAKTSRRVSPRTLHHNSHSLAPRLQRSRRTATPHTLTHSPPRKKTEPSEGQGPTTPNNGDRERLFTARTVA